MLVIMSIIDVTDGMTNVSSDQLPIVISLLSSFTPKGKYFIWEAESNSFSNFSPYLHVWENRCQQWHCLQLVVQNVTYFKWVHNIFCIQLQPPQNIKSKLYCGRLFGIGKHSIVYCIVKQLVIYTLNIICILWSNRPTFIAADWLFWKTN